MTGGIFDSIILRCVHTNTAANSESELVESRHNAYYLY